MLERKDRIIGGVTRPAMSAPVAVFLSVVLAAAWCVQPVVAQGPGSGSAERTAEAALAQGVHTEAARADQKDHPPHTRPAETPASVAALADRIVMVMPAVYSANDAWIAAARARIAEQLIALDVAPDQAAAQAAQLTADDLEVLLANPDMMQRAGSAGQLEKTVILAAIVIGVIVLIGVAAGSGGLSTG